MYIHVNGAKYEGEWKDDLQHGYGVERWYHKFINFKGLMDRNTKVITKKAKNMDKAPIAGVTDQSTVATGTKIPSPVSVLTHG